MSKAKFTPVVYHALRSAGHSNRQIAAMLGVNEASVRRGLAGWTPLEAPIRRTFVVTVEEQA